MKSAVARIPSVADPTLIIGKAPIVRAAFESRDQFPLWQELFARVSANPADGAAFLDLSILLRAMGDHAQARICEQAALDIGRQYRIINGTGTGLRVLVLVTAGDFMANTPIEFLLEASDTTILLRYVDAQAFDLSDLPAHDVAFLAVGESAENLPVLDALRSALQGWSGPILNAAPDRIRALSRDGVAASFAGDPLVLAPPIARTGRDELSALAAGQIELGAILAGLQLPVIIRPVGTHAGKGMEKIGSLESLYAYLAAQEGDEFFIMPFVDYSSADGKFRKQRIAFIDGKAYPSHLAISDKWMVHYLNAGMVEHVERRVEEAAWMSAFDEDCAVRHGPAFDSIVRRIGLDYFAIDCAELPDGRILLFEADVAMIVHSMDWESLFPYKKKAMARLFEAFERALVSRVARSPGA